MDARAGRRPSDLARQIAVISATCFMIVAALVGAGVTGGSSVQDLQGGALAADGSFLAPASPAFSIWTVVYVGLVAYAVWQALPGQRSARAQRAVGWWVAASEVLNGSWLVAAQFATLELTVVTIFALAAVLAIAFQRTVAVRGDGVLDAVLRDGVTGLHLGWVSLAAVANTAAWLTRAAPEGWADAAVPVGIGVLVVVAAIGVAIGLQGRGRLAPPAAMAWGLAWIGVGRLAGEPASTPLGVAAIAAGVVVLAAAIVRVIAARAARS